MTEDFIPIVMFSGITLVMCLYFWFRYRARLDMQQTVRLALDKGHDLSPEMIDRLGHPKASKDKDLRIALIWLGIAGGMFLCSFVVPDPTDDAQRGLLAAAAFPFMLGIAYLAMWRFTSRD
mgnify:FL=1